MRRFPVVTLVVTFLFALGASASAQIEPGSLAQQSLRAYWHVFIAYTIAWAFIFGWVVSIARRLGRVARELEG